MDLTHLRGWLHLNFTALGQAVERVNGGILRISESQYGFFVQNVHWT